MLEWNSHKSSSVLEEEESTVAVIVCALCDAFRRRSGSMSPIYVNGSHCFCRDWKKSSIRRCLAILRFTAKMNSTCRLNSQRSARLSEPTWRSSYLCIEFVNNYWDMQHRRSGSSGYNCLPDKPTSGLLIRRRPAIKKSQFGTIIYILLIFSHILCEHFRELTSPRIVQSYRSDWPQGAWLMVGKTCTHLLISCNN